MKSAILLFPRNNLFRRGNSNLRFYTKKDGGELNSNPTNHGKSLNDLKKKLEGRGVLSKLHVLSTQCKTNYEQSAILFR